MVKLKFSIEEREGGGRSSSPMGKDSWGELDVSKCVDSLLEKVVKAIFHITWCYPDFIVMQMLTSK